MTEDDQKRVPSASPPVAADPPPAHSITSMLLRLWQRVSLPVAKPETFQDKREIEDAVATRSPDVALDLLAEAREIYDAPIARAESVERRATTLIGAVAVAASLTVAGGSLLVDPARIRDTWWRVALSLLLLLVVLAFVMSGWRAVQALSRVHKWTYPNDEDILKHRDLGLARARGARAVALLRSAGANEPIARWKVAHLSAATWWFLKALVLLVGTAVVLLAYAIFGPNVATPHIHDPSTRCEYWKPHRKIGEGRAVNRFRSRPRTTRSNRYC